MDLGYIYLIAVNIISFSFCVYDKICAIHNKWRIKEKVLLTLSLIGGSVGMFAGMVLVRHKIKKPIFFLGVPIMMFIQFLLIGSFSKLF